MVSSLFCISLNHLFSVGGEEENSQNLASYFSLFPLAGFIILIRKDNLQEETTEYQFEFFIIEKMRISLIFAYLIVMVVSKGKK